MRRARFGRTNFARFPDDFSSLYHALSVRVQSILLAQNLILKVWILPKVLHRDTEQEKIVEVFIQTHHLKCCAELYTHTHHANFVPRFHVFEFVYFYVLEVLEDRLVLLSQQLRELSVVQQLGGGQGKERLGDWTLISRGIPIMNSCVCVGNSGKHTLTDSSMCS